MKNYFLAVPLFLCCIVANAQRSDIELNRDSVVGWNYVTLPSKTKTYTPVKDNLVPGSSYTVWQQKTSDLLFNWVQQSVLPKGLVIRDILQNNAQSYLNGAPALHSYGIQLIGYAAHFKDGKIDLKCCEKSHYFGLGFNNFPGYYLQGGFNPDGLYYFAEYAQFSTGDKEDKLKAEGVDKQILPALHAYRTYLDHYHDNGKAWNRIGIVIAKNNEWPFKPVLVKDVVNAINNQLAAYPGIEQKNPYEVKNARQVMEQLRPYYNEVTKLGAGNPAMLKDDDGHAILNPDAIRNGKEINNLFPEYSILVSTNQQTINQSKTDKPMWLYMDFSFNNFAVKNLADFNPNFDTEREYFVNTLLRNLNFDYVAKWLSQPEAMKNTPYTPVNAPIKSFVNNISQPTNISTTAANKNKDTNTILYEDFSGYATGTFSAKGWHTYGNDGHSFENATLADVNGRPGKWISIPDVYTFYPDVTKPLPASFTVNYDVYFSSNISNKRTPIYFRLETNDPKKSNTIDLHDINRNGFQFALPLSGETETNKRFMKANVDEKISQKNISGLKANDVAHVSITINGAAVTVSVNGKEVMQDNNVLPAGYTFKRMGWYCGVPGIGLSNIYVKNDK